MPVLQSAMQSLGGTIKEELCQQFQSVCSHAALSVSWSHRHLTYLLSGLLAAPGDKASNENVGPTPARPEL